MQRRARLSKSLRRVFQVARAAAPHITDNMACSCDQITEREKVHPDRYGRCAIFDILTRSLANVVCPRHVLPQVLFPAPYWDSMNFGYSGQSADSLAAVKRLQCNPECAGHRVPPPFPDH